MEGSGNDADRLFGEALRRALESSGLTTVELAQRLNVTERSLRRYMSGDRRPDLGIVERWELISNMPQGSLVDAYRALPPRRGAAPKLRAADGSAPLDEPATNGRHVRRRRAAALGWPIAVVALAAIAILGGAIGLVGDDETPPSRLVDAPRAQSPRPAEREILTIDNRVTRGLNMVEDVLPLRLTTKPWINCLNRRCAIRGTERRTGGTYDAAICQTKGESTTNGDDTSPADDENPNRHVSTRYYLVQFVDGRYGYVSEVWLADHDRGGLGLPFC